MRKVIDHQLKIGEVDISAIQFDLRSRDDIPKLLLGLQHIYCTSELRDQVFSILREIIPEGVAIDNGRPGMHLWRIFVLGTLRLDCNWDFDRLREMANNHKKIREMLGHGLSDADYCYSLQTLKDNLSLFTPEVLDRINQVVVSAGHQFLGKKKDEGLTGRCDSFVVETNVHYPTDINLLLDAIGKVINLVSAACWRAGIPGWRQRKHNLRKIRKLFHRARKSYRSKTQNESKREKKDRMIREAYLVYIDVVASFLPRANESLTILRVQDQISSIKAEEISRFIHHAERQIDQIHRRVFKGEVIAHNEKIFSVFEEHTEWIVKGKAGISQELGLRVCILEDQFGFILHHHVMEKQEDKDVAVLITLGAKQRFPNLFSCSYDKGFYTPSNRDVLVQIVTNPVLPKKGKLSLKEKEKEYSDEFIRCRRQHSAVESAINALEHHGLDRCLDHGIIGFKRYVALAVVARNIHILGELIQKQQKKQLKHAA